jgi:acyl-CoA synthetase (AMP-forming)/AMP-acid ligase II
VLVSANGPELAFGGPPEPRREGRVYPTDEVVDVVARLPFCKGAFVMPIAQSGVTLRHKFSLCIFNGAESIEENEKRAGERANDVERAIGTHLGRDFLPEHVEFFPLYPRLAKGALDVEWCETQYRTGLLAKKARNPMFLALTAVRGRCVVDAAEATP